MPVPQTPDRTRGSARGKAAAARKPAADAGRGFEIDRIVVMRIALLAIVIVFLYLILRVAIIAFGGGGAQEAKRIERIVDQAAVSGRAPPAAAPRPDAAKPAGPSAP